MRRRRRTSAAALAAGCSLVVLFAALFAAAGALLAASPAAAVPAEAPPAAVAGGGGDAASVDGDEVRRRVARILAVPGYQTAMPEAAEPEPPPPPPSWAPWMTVLGTVFLFAVAAAGLALLAYLLWDLVRRRGVPRPPPARAVPPPPLPARAAAAAGELPDAEALAAAGRFGEAVHALLLHALAALARRRGAPLPPSLTGREAVAASGLPEAPRGALAELVAAVERFLFAGRPLDAADWHRCRDAFDRLEAGAA